MFRLFFIVFALLLSTNLAYAEDSLETSVYERVLKTGKIRCGYTIYPPFHIVDANTGDMSGVGFDIVNKIGELLSLEIVWAEEVSAGSVLQGLVANRIDMVCTPFWHTAERSRIAAFTLPVFFTSMDAWVRYDDSRFDKLEDLNSSDVTISTLDGATIGNIVRGRFPQAKTLSIAEMAPVSDLMTNVVNGKADAVIIENSQAIGFLQNNPESIKKIEPGPMQVYANGFPIKISEIYMKSMIDGALQELHNNGYIERILGKYQKDYPLVFLVPAKSYQTP